MRTWERGVEGETLACGTGAVACALVVGTLGLATSPVRLWTRSGLPLDVAWKASGTKAQSLTLSGEGRLVFRGIVGEPARQ
jgi:diaminopimelate epimerase